MQYVFLGSQNREIPVIGQGCWGIGGYFTADSSRDAEDVAALQAGIEAGMTFLDTAEVYGAGHSEEVVAEAIRGCREKVFLASKVSPEHLAFDDVKRAAEGSLKRLKTDYLDLYQIHWPNPAISIVETMRAMRDLYDEGLVRHVGLSNFSARAAHAARSTLPCVEVCADQVEYNLFDRSVEEELLPYCQSVGMLLIAYTPLDKGILLDEDPRSAGLKMIAGRYGVTPAQMCLKWLVTHPGVVAIPKAVGLRHLKENAAAADVPLSREDFEEIGRIFQPTVRMIPPERIRADKKNLDGFIPGVDELAATLLEGEPLKPVRVQRAEAQAKEDYVLVEGKLRYWAWVQAFDGRRPVPALIRGD